MYTKIASATAVVLASSSLVAAQTSRTCDIPDCPVMSAFGSEQVTIDFTKGESNLFNASTGSTPVTYDDSLGAVFSIAKDTDAPTFSSTKYRTCPQYSPLTANLITNPFLKSSLAKLM